MKVILLVLLEPLVHKIKSLVLTLLRQRQTFAWVYITVMIIIICVLMQKEIFKFKAKSGNVNFPTQFRLGRISNGFSATESREASFKRKCVRLFS